MSQQSIIDKTMMIPRDFGESFSARITGDGATRRYTLPRDNVDSSTLVAYIDGDPVVVLSLGADPGNLQENEYALDARQGVLTLWDDLALGAVLVVEGTAHLNLSVEDYTTYVEIAFGLHTQNRNPPITYDSLPPHEEYLVGLLATIEILWSLVTEAAGEIDVLTPEGVQIPRSQRFAQYMALIERLTAYYKDLAAVLNVGPFRIEMFTLRRVSRTTNRLVPVYVPQEFDDRDFPPARVYPPIDPGGPVVAPEE